MSATKLSLGKTTCDTTLPSTLRKVIFSLVLYCIDKVDLIIIKFLCEITVQSHINNITIIPPVIQLYVYLITKSIGCLSAGHLAWVPGYPSQLLLDPTMMSRALLIFLMTFQQTFAGCPFGNPFYFVDIPKVNRVTDVGGEEVPDRWVGGHYIV